MRFAVVDLFAGAGGLGEGFSRAGFDNVLSCEAEATFTETLKLRHFARCTAQAVSYTHLTLPTNREV